MMHVTERIDSLLETVQSFGVSRPLVTLLVVETFLFSWGFAGIPGSGPETTASKVLYDG